MADTETKAWLKTELVSALGFAEVDEIVAYITSTFRSKQEASSYLVELLGIPAARAEHIGTRLFAPAPPPAAPKETEGLVPRPTAVNSRFKPSKKGKKAAALLNNALIINCLRCGRIEYNGGRRCAFCDSELHYEADAATADHAAQQHMEELVRLDETGAQRTRVLDAEQYFYDEEQVGQRREEEGDDTGSSSSSARRPITMALDLENRQFVDVKIARNEQLAKDARELVDGVQRKMSKGKRGKGGQQQTEMPPRSGGIREALVVVDDSYSLVFVAALDKNRAATPRRKLARQQQHFQICLLQCTAPPRDSRPQRPPIPAMSTTVSAAKGPNALQRRVAESASQSTAPANPLWDFYACGLVDENDDCSEGEDTEDELETQDYILFQRQRAQARLANAHQREARVLRAAKH
ncbi:hypothetical protein PHYSODRAFT_345158 [Phytophthora sojae]|uniref:Uncharacterized protein n=1 Tax=Phytophthora sojae (strain P6497) TaxID=1094619 RepID=G4Z0S8_PHYSP|nr:hypothetical protein PHYSODRAFT_345158 [Phytophthora sojae]EGZ26384.1 hypothetical protein PHYSODRAFT_345158 [Phytophthora sojae]|eukprot:XP_009521672.1 hypothetical protein PHYSODRAFT_345158 [Phytophthora sojae]